MTGYADAYVETALPYTWIRRRCPLLSHNPGYTPYFRKAARPHMPEINVAGYLPSAAAFSDYEGVLLCARNGLAISRMGVLSSQMTGR